MHSQESVPRTSAEVGSRPQRGAVRRLRHAAAGPWGCFLAVYLAHITYYQFGNCISQPLIVRIILSRKPTVGPKYKVVTKYPGPPNSWNEKLSREPVRPERNIALSSYNRALINQSSTQSIFPCVYLSIYVFICLFVSVCLSV